MIKNPFFKFELPDLIEIQKKSYKWFWEKGLRELLDEFSPIIPWGNKELEFHFLDYHLDEPNMMKLKLKIIMFPMRHLCIVVLN